MVKRPTPRPVLALGTAQFGGPYGVANQRGQIPEHEISAILDAASAAGVAFLDTAPRYGNAEEVIGRYLKPSHHLRLITKTITCSAEVLTASEVVRVRDTFLRSLNRLQVESVYALLVHKPEDLQKPGGKRLVEMLLGLRRDHLVQKLGVSVYDEDQLKLAQRVLKPDIVQLPLSLFDQRLLESGVIEQLHASGMEVHVRSIFLQGVILMQAKQLPEHLFGLSSHLKRFHAAVASRGLTPLQAALRFVSDQENIQAVIVGVASLAELNQVIEAARSERRFEDVSEFAVETPELLDPRRWTAPATVTC
jgi:aryl-alcohol dehydrogenase-like predicted oxidoreductase